jgi:tight adherence protein C
LAIYATVGAIFGVMAPVAYIGRRGRMRQRTITNELADMLDLLVVSVEAGLGINEALKVVGAECNRQHEEIGHELAIVSGEMAAGATLGDTLANLAERTAVEDFRPLAATLVQSEQLGAKIGPALRASSDALRSQRRLRAEEAGQKASVKILFPLVLLILPAMMMLIIGPAVIKALRTLSGV